MSRSLALLKARVSALERRSAGAQRGHPNRIIEALSTEARIVAILLKLAEVADVNGMDEVPGMLIAGELGVWPTMLQLEAGADVAS